MPTGKGFYIVVHEYSNTSVGHVNLELIHNGKRVAWLGANQNGINKLEPGLKGKIFDETKDSIIRINKFPKDHAITVRNVSEQEFNIMYNRANHLFNTKKDYDITDNCLHFVDDVLSHGYKQYGTGKETLTHYVNRNTLANFYAALTSMGIKMGDPNLKEETYREFIQRNRALLSEHKNFLDLKLEEVRESLQTGKIAENGIYADGSVIINVNGNLDTKKFGRLTGRDIYISENSGDQHYEIHFGKNQNDIIYDSDGKDKLTLNIQDHSKLWFAKDGINLKITNLENNGSVTILDWFKRRWRGGFKRRYENVLTHRIENISTQTGKSISSAQVDKLVQAMSTFTPDKNGQINLSPQQQTDLSNIISANWS